MAIKGLSYQEVVSAIDNIIKDHDKPSINKIRHLIGYGSLTTISKYFKQWKSCNKDKHSNILKSYDNACSKNNNKNKFNNSHNIDSNKYNKNYKQLQNIDSFEIDNSIIQSLVAGSASLSTDILNNMSEEWSVILNEPNEDIKIKKLYAALVKEQMRRETAEKISKEAKSYADNIKEQATQRIADIRDSLEEQIAFLNGQIRQLKHDAEKSLDHYRSQLEKSNLHLAFLKKNHDLEKNIINNKHE